MINILLVEDKKMPRDCITGYIKGSDRYQLQAAITNAGMAEMACMRYPIDLILMDVCTENNESGIEAAEVIKRHFPKIKIIMITSMLDTTFIAKAKQAQADSFWYKEISEHELLDIMDRTMNDESVYPDQIPKVRIGQALSNSFTSAELEVLRLLVKGQPDAVIAENLHISVSTVRWHIKELFEKTGYNNRVTLACDVINKNLIVPDF